MLDYSELLVEALTSDASVTTDRVSAIGASQIELELLYSKSQLVPCLIEDFRTDFEAELQASELPVDFGLMLLVQMHLHRRAGPDTLIGMLKHHFKDAENPAQACAQALELACSMDLCDSEYVTKYDPDGQPYQTVELVMRYEASPETVHMTDLFQYPLPLIEQPLEARTNRDTGYHTIRGSLILKNNHHDQDICLDHINRLNAIPLAINSSVVAFIQNAWKNLDKRQADESYEDFRKRKKAFLRYDQNSRDVIDALLTHGDRFWLTHRYDKRGRTYSQGYHVNYQGSDWNKACVEFADKEPLNKE